MKKDNDRIYRDTRRYVMVSLDTVAQVEANGNRDFYTIREVKKSLLEAKRFLDEQLEEK